MIESKIFTIFTNGKMNGKYLIMKEFADVSRLSGGIEKWMKDAEESAAEITKAFLDVKTIPGLVFNVFMIAFLPAVGEELLFRGIIQRIFTDMTKSHHWGIWISAILFSAMHFQFYGFVPRVLLGALFGYLLVWSGSII